MAMSHANCTHPRTPAGRAACRAAGGATATPRPASAERVPTEKAGVVPARPATRTKPKLSTKNIKQPGHRLRTEGDMADMPRLLGHGVRLAWAHDLPVTVGPVFREDERIVVIHGSHAMVYLTWRPGTELFSVSTKPNDMSVWTRRTTIEGAIRISMGDETE